MIIKKQKFTKKFKLEVLHLVNQPNTSITQLARNLGIRHNMIYKWMEQLNTKQDKALKELLTILMHLITKQYILNC